MEILAVPAWADRKRGVVVVEDDVQNVVRDLKGVDSRIVVYYNDQSEGFDIVERCLDGVERLVFSVQTLDQRAVTRLREADHWHGSDRPNHVLGDDEDVISVVDAHNQKVEADRDEEMCEQLAYAGEAVAWALDLCADRSSPGGSIVVPRGI